MNRLLIVLIMIFSIELAVTISSCGKACHEPDHDFKIFDSWSFCWIPKGLMWDLMDNTTTETFPGIDNVNGFTIAQLFNALQSDVTSVPAYKARFIQQNLGNQNANITSLFAQYHY